MNREERVAALFPAAPRAEPLIGAEVELLARDADTGMVARLDGSLGAWLRDGVARNKWHEATPAKGARRYVLTGGGTITLEPGGQLEYSSPPFPTPRTLIEQLQSVLSALCESALESGVLLQAVGIDPLHPIAEVPLQLEVPRYLQMDEYFRAVGSGSGAGARMMRQTAAIQVNVDPAFDSVRTWDVLQRAAPVLTALFANSRMYEGRDSGYASYRAYTWTELDPGRTGIIEPSARAYLQFALDARCIADAPAYRPFRDLADATDADWVLHLSTLFPEVRPKGYLEVRSMDVIPLESIAAPVLTVAAIAWDDHVLSAVSEELPAADRAALVRAARHGLADPEMAARADALTRVVLSACTRAGSTFASPADVQALSGWLEQSVAAGRASLEDHFIRDDHVADDPLASLGK
jgi:glutamate--cysteine ligase